MSLEELVELLEYESCYVRCTEEWQAIQVVTYLVDAGCVVTEIEQADYGTIPEFVNAMFEDGFTNPNIYADEVNEVVMWSTVDDHKPIEYEDFMQMIQLNDVEFDANIFNALI